MKKQKKRLKRKYLLSKLLLKIIYTYKNEGFKSLIMKGIYKFMVIKENLSASSPLLISSLFPEKIVKKINGTFSEKNYFWNLSQFLKIKPLRLSDAVDIIVCFGGNSKLLKSCIGSISKHTNLKYNLYVVSHLKDVQLIIDLNNKIKIITHNMDFFNFSKANNYAMFLSDNDIVLLNDDVEVTPFWLDNLRKDSRGFALTGAHTYFKKSGNPDMWRQGEMKITWYPINMFCAYIPQRIIRVVGLLDEEFSYYGGEDIDYSCKVLKNGFPLVVSSAFVRHKSNGSFRKNKIKLIKESNKIISERYFLKPPFNLNKIKPLISVIIATKNREKLLSESTRSILNGTYKNIEVIIVDDGSRDGTWEKMIDLQKLDRRIIGVKLPFCQGSVEARKRGIEISKGDFIAFMDDDDIAKKNRLISPLEYLLMHPDVDVAYCKYDIVSENFREAGKVREFNKEDYLALRFNIGAGALLVRKKVLKEVPFMSSYENAVDFDWVFRLIRKGYKISYCPDNVLDYNRSGGVKSHLAGNIKALSMHRSIILREKLINKILSQNDKLK